MTNNDLPLQAPYKLPASLHTDSPMIKRFVKELEDLIVDRAYEWAMDLPEISLPIHLEDEELDEAISTVTSQLEVLVYQALAIRAGIKS